MVKQFLEGGKIVGTHGVRGEMRVECWCDSPQFLAQFKTLYFDEGKEKVKVQSRAHKNMVLMKMPDVTTIEQADQLRGKIVYINRDDINLGEGVNFVQDLIGLEVRDVDNDTVYGKISDVIRTGSNISGNSVIMSILIVKNSFHRTNKYKSVVYVCFNYNFINNRC